MAFNFPASPSVGDKYPTPAIAGAPVWQWDGSAWKAIGGQGLGQIYIADTAPTAAPDGSLWWESDSGMLYIRYNDGDSSQWVAAVPVTDTSNFITAAAPQTLTATQQAQARANIAAAPIDALAFNGLQVNGSLGVSQERGTTALVGSGYVVDCWTAFFSGAMVISSALAVDGLTVGAPLVTYVATSITTAAPSLSAGDHTGLAQAIEGLRVMRLAWGTAKARPVTIGFWTAHQRTGVYSVSVRNAAANRSYVTTYTQVAAGVWQYNTVTVPGDTSGTWVTDTSKSFQLYFAAACGTTLTAPSANSWQAGNYVAAPGQINGVAATSDVFRLTCVSVIPGLIAPTSDQSPLIMRPTDQEILLCERYWRKLDQIFAGGYGPASANIWAHSQISPSMRASPIATLANIATNNASVLAADAVTPTFHRAMATITATGTGWSASSVVLDARF